MPVPEDTVTTSPDCASPAVLEKHPSSDETQTEKQMLSASSQWEEPHPGQRYAVTAVGNARPGAVNYNQGCNGVSKAGMAAKAYSPYPTRGWSAGTRRFAPARLRTPSSRLVKSAQDTGTARLSVHTTHSNTSSTTPVIARSETRATTGCPVFGCLGSSNISSEPHAADTKQTALSQSENAPPHLSMTDFSGFLTPGLTTVTTNSDASSFMSLDTEKPLILTPDDDPDPYGWEAELGKRVQLGEDTDMSVYCPAIEYRRAAGTKRTLLQRVLSFGPTKEG